MTRIICLNPETLDRPVPQPRIFSQGMSRSSQVFVHPPATLNPIFRNLGLLPFDDLVACTPCPPNHDFFCAVPSQTNPTHTPPAPLCRLANLDSLSAIVDHTNSSPINGRTSYFAADPRPWHRIIAAAGRSSPATLGSFPTCHKSFFPPSRSLIAPCTYCFSTKASRKRSICYVCCRFTFLEWESIRWCRFNHRVLIDKVRAF